MLDGYIKHNEDYLLKLRNHRIHPGVSAAGSHFHYFLEISCVKKGRGVYRVENKTFDIREGDVFLFNNIERHGLSVVPPDNMENLVLMFDPRFVWSMEHDIFDHGYLEVFFNRNERFENRLDRNNPATRTVYDKLLEIEREFAEKAPGYELMVKVHLLSALVMIIRSFGYVSAASGSSLYDKKELVRIHAIIDYIDANYTSGITLEDIAKNVYMNTAYLCVFFKKYMGISVMQYIRKKRIGAAADLLKNTDRTVTEIAGLCGFNDASYFTRVFREPTGAKPSEARSNGGAY